VHIRRPDVDDVDDVAELARLRAIWHEQVASSDFLAAFREWFLREQLGRWWWIAVDDREAVGMVTPR
jgi:hypothetical protein